MGGVHLGVQPLKSIYSVHILQLAWKHFCNNSWNVPLLRKASSLWWSDLLSGDLGKLFRLPPWVQPTLKRFTGGFRQRIQLVHKPTRNLWKQPSYVSDMVTKCNFLCTFYVSFTLQRRYPRQTVALMWHLWRFSLLYVTVKVLVDRCLQTGVCRAGLMYEWMQFGGSLKAVVVTTGRLHTSCHMETNSAKYPVAFILSVCLDSLCPRVPTSLSVLHRGNNKAHTTIVNQRTYLQACDCILHQEAWGQMIVAP